MPARHPACCGERLARHTAERDPIALMEENPPRDQPGTLHAARRDPTAATRDSARDPACNKGSNAWQDSKQQ